MSASICLRRSLALLLLSLGMGLGALPAPAQPADSAAVTGDWMGTLAVGGTELRVVVHLRDAADGGLTGTMDSPDQGAEGIPLGTVEATADTLRFAVPSIAGRFAGVIAEDGQSIEGQWAQGGGRLPLTLERATATPTVRRPQEPEPPFPYTIDSLTFRNPEADLTLAGTLTRPDTAAAVPGVVLVAGSGPQDRDGTIMGHRPFRVLADALTRRGLAVLRFDERGVGESEGTQAGATTADFATDVRAALHTLAERPGVDAERVGIIGHSEGGLIAPMVATRTDTASFLVLLAAPGLPGDVILADQLDRRIRQQGADARTRAMQRGTQRRIFDVLEQEADSAAIADQLRQIMLEVEGISGEATIEREIRRLMDPWLRFFIRHDPRTTLRKVEVPVLALAGSKDQQVAPDTNQTAIAEALRAEQRADVTVRTLEGLNHLFQTAETGAVSEYGRIEQTFAPKAIEAIAAWIEAQTTEGAAE